MTTRIIPKQWRIFSRLFTRNRSGLFTKNSSGLLLIWFLAVPAFASLDQDRITYSKALKALYAGNADSFKTARASLEHYSLYPYLEYAQLRQTISVLSEKDVQSFRSMYADIPIANRLHKQWLQQLALKGDWQRYRSNYEEDNSVSYRCNYLRSLYQTGDKSLAMQGVTSLWLSARSQSKVCDPLFRTWIANGQLTQELVWQRLHLALAANNKTLASYLLRYFTGPLKRTSMTYYQVHGQAKLLNNHNRFSPDTVYVRNIIAHGLLRWANFDPRAAHRAWQKYQLSHSFTDYEKQRILQGIQLRMARNNILPNIDSVPVNADGTHEPLIEAIALAAVRNQSWSDVLLWIARLPEQVKSKPMWQYWKARSGLNQDGAPEAEIQSSINALESLSRSRTYYGFLAAHTLGIEPRLNHQVSKVDLTTLKQVADLPGMQRALELYAINDVTSATREWLLLTEHMSKTELAAVSVITAKAGWLNQSIRAANLAELHDDLSLRFPTPFREIFTREAQSSKVPETLLYGISRQESAFAPTVVSPAGAMGIMQLLPTTAVETARKSGLRRPVRKQLLLPETNIKLGSRYLAGLLERFEGNRAVAAAAYNAGPTRTSQWLRRKPADPIDIWIESIPYKETRAYVKNVLAFSYIFSEHLNGNAPFLSESEAANLPRYMLAP